MDDFTVYGATFKEALKNVAKVLQQCEGHNLSLNSKKCFIMMQEGIMLGYCISQSGIQFDPAQIEVILDLPAPTKQKDVRGFLGHVGYYRRFIKDFSKMAVPLYSLLTKDTEFEWTPTCGDAFYKLKGSLTQAPVLKGPDWSLSFHIHIEVSDFAIGAVLGKKKGVLQNAIYYIS
ncbi:uncharacterized mitochondrial protein AtMg00860-like [Cryptomeria japonica]|uniref:uncharacterized mitochondrial protein AtMg00860-like n=1 Tax=Cryptomeria japonica TaxID=3369 RepID=UPI0027DA172D|nr:uncharacterized mitochondrial protein AtMg00860-like [Cryptomeria japonica]